MGLHQSGINELVAGASAGIAYHLGIDATIDGDGKYMDLPFSTTQEVHQAIAATNAMAEGLDAVARLSRWGDTVATYGQLTDAREAIMTTDTPSSFVIQRLDHDKGFRITWPRHRAVENAERPVVTFDALVQVNKNHAWRLLAFVAEDRIEVEIAVRIDLLVVRVVFVGKFAKLVVTNLGNIGKSLGDLLN